MTTESRNARLFVTAIGYAPTVTGSKYRFPQRFEVLAPRPDNDPSCPNRACVRHIATGVTYFADWFVYAKKKL